MKIPFRSILVPALGLALFASACGSDSKQGGAMFIEACSLNCINSGTVGSLVTCGVHNTFQNQEIGVLFSKDIDIDTVNDLTFLISDTQTAAFPPGDFVIDSNNPRRVIFRPLLDFDQNGNPVFGFGFNRTYNINIPGSSQGSPPPYIQSTEGQGNESKLFCTITTDQGITDPVPGKPSVQIFVDTLSGNDQPAQGAVDVLTTSKITFVFNDVMDIGTLVVNGQSIGFLNVFVDTDGNLQDPSDQIPIAGSYAYFIDLSTLTTTVAFTASSGLPTKGNDPLNPRLIVVNVLGPIADIAGNTISNPGQTAFTPEGAVLPPQILPAPGGEGFTSTTLRDAKRTGAEWGTATSGRLTPGNGGGSGRLGDLVIGAGQTVTLKSGPTKARGTLTLSGNPQNNDTLFLNGSTPLIYKNNQVTGTVIAGGIAIEAHPPYTSYSLSELVNFLNSSVDPLLSVASYWLESGNVVVIEYKVAGTVGNAYTFSVVPGAFINNWTASGPTLAAGEDFQTFDSFDTLTNFDFQTTPAGTPPDIEISNGIFEFSFLSIASGGRLQFLGTPVPRIFVRGQALIQGTIDVSGNSPNPHPSSAPPGQRGATGGPLAGKGGNGGDRRDYTGSNLLSLAPGSTTLSAAVKNPGGFIQGRIGQGVALVGSLGAGPGGVQWPTLFPNSTTFFNDFETASSCESEQIAAPGGGGAYSQNGQPGVAVALNPLSSQGGSNVPPPTAGGDAAALGIEPPGAPPDIRKLTPKKGYLRGGSGGGGGGTSIAQTTSDGAGAGDPCLGSGAVIDIFRDQSGAGGGGGGGAIQIAVGSSAQIAGLIDASGGDGGSAQDTAAPINDQSAAPGGGGSGGAVLLQAKNMQFNVFAPPRISVAGGFGGSDNTGSLGGTGGAGLLRLETKPPLPDLNQVYTLLNPVDVPGGPTFNVFASVGNWAVERTFPDSYSGAQSCWFRPVGVNFYKIVFDQDLPPNLGWDMDLLLKVGAATQTVSYRTDGLAPGSQSYEEFWGTEIAPDLTPGASSAPVVVRFQGARLSQSVSDFCALDPNEPTTGILFGSTTAWVQHPAELNAFNPPPDIIRFAVLFDSADPDFVKLVGVTNLRIFVTPD